MSEDRTIADRLKDRGLTDEQLERLGYGTRPPEQVRNLNAVVDAVCYKGRRYTVTEALDQFGRAELEAAIHNRWVFGGDDDVLLCGFEIGDK